MNTTHILSILSKCKKVKSATNDNIRHLEHQHDKLDECNRLIRKYSMQLEHNKDVEGKLVERLKNAYESLKYTLRIRDENEIRMILGLQPISEERNNEENPEIPNDTNTS